MARFPSRTLQAIDATHFLYLRAGERHRFIPVWVVVVDGRVLVRSWNDKAGGWRRAFAREPHGAIQLGKGKRELPVLAAPVRGARLLDAMDAACAEKYTTPANLAYVRGFRTARRRAATVELVPAVRRGSTEAGAPSIRTCR